MTPVSRRRFTFLCAAGLAGTRAGAEGNRPEVAKILVPFPTGGTMDLIARLLADAMRGEMADTIVVENKTGAAGRIAVDALRQAPPDGATMMIHAGGVQSMYPHTFRQISYDPFTDLAAVSLVTRVEFGFAVGPAVPAEVTTLANYLAWIKADPKRASFATPGSGTPLHFLPLLLGRNNKVEMTPVHYRGTTAALPDLLGGSVPALSAPVPDLVQQLPTGKVRILATSGPQRGNFTPNVATYAEQGFAQLTSSDWYGIFVNGKTPATVKERMSMAVRSGLAVPATAAGFAKAFIEPVSSTPAEALQRARADHERWGGIVKILGYVPEA